MTSYEQTAFSRLIREARLARHISLRQLAERLGLSVLDTSSAERGRIPRLGEQHWPRLAHVLGVSREQLQVAYDASPAEPVEVQGGAYLAYRTCPRCDGDGCDYCYGGGGYCTAGPFAPPLRAKDDERHVDELLRDLQSRDGEPVLIPLPPSEPLTEEAAADGCDTCGEWDLIGSGHLVGEPCPDASSTPEEP